MHALQVVGSSANRFQVVHSHFYSMALSARRVAQNISAYHIHTEHSSNLVTKDPTMRPSRAGRRMLAKALRSVSELFVVSDSLATALNRQGFTRHMHVVPNPVDDALFWPRPKQPHDAVRLITVGSLIGRKDHQLLLEALAHLAGMTSRPIYLTVVGDGELRGQLEALATELDLARLVDFRGRLNRADVAELYRTSDIYVQASRAETFGVAVAEALMSGLPVVVRQAGGLTDEIREDQGIAVRNGSSREVAEALSQVIAKLDVYDGNLIAADARRCFSIDSVAGTISSIYAPYLRPS